MKKIALGRMKRIMALVLFALVAGYLSSQISITINFSNSEAKEIFLDRKSNDLNGTFLSKTRYDYTNVAKKITKGCKSKREKSCAIYEWICDNIQYDTSYRIYTADECYDNKKGVCKAYSELFYRLCEPVGVECEIVEGVSKDEDGIIGAGGHAWIVAKVEEGPILIDPTWGAGYVNNGKFYFRDNHSYWFDVDPYWMIFTHFPNEEKYQFLEKSINKQEFRELPPLDPSHEMFGWQARKMYNALRTKKITSLPKIFGDDFGSIVGLIDIPLQNNLNPATTYHFEIEKKKEVKLAIVINGRFICDNEWKQSGNRYSIDLIPEEGGQLDISIKVDDNSYSTIAKYNISYPTAEEKKYIATRKRPIIHGDVLDKHGLKVVDIPTIKLLNPATTYHFEFKKNSGNKLAIIINNRWVHDVEWEYSGNNYSINLMPEEGGNLCIGVQNNQGSYTWVAEYKVSYPTASEEKYIASHKRPIIDGNVLNEYGLSIVSIPKKYKLTPSTNYHFELEGEEPAAFAVVVNETWYKENQWTCIGTRCYIDITPNQEGRLTLYVKRSNGWYTRIAEYIVKK